MIQHKESFLLYLCMLVMGASGLAYEYTLSKVSSDLLGNSVSQWALTIGFMMFFMGIGADLQKKFKDEHCLFLFIAGEMTLAFVGAIAPISSLYLYGSFNSHYVLFHYLFIATIGLLIGFEIPLLTRINSVYLNDLKLNIGNILKMDYVGSLLGAVFWLFVVIKYFDLIEGAFLIGIISLLTSLLPLLFFRKELSSFKGLFISWCVLLSILSVGMYYGQSWALHAEQRLYKDRVVLSKSSPFQHVVMTKSNDNKLSMYINGHIQFSELDENRYHENLVHPLMASLKHKKRILILGGGDGLALREVLKYKEVNEVVLCDIDPLIVNLAKTRADLVRLNKNSFKDARVSVIKNSSLRYDEEYYLSQESRRNIHDISHVKTAKLRVYHLDAIKFLENIRGRFDGVIIDFPDPNSPELSKLYSLRFYNLLKSRLNKGGMWVQQSSSPFFAKEAFLMIGRTMKTSMPAVIAYRDFIPSFGEWGFWLASTAHLNSQGLLNSIKDLKEIPVETSFLDLNKLKANFVFSSAELYSEDHRINTMTSMALFNSYLEGWEKYF